jgi:hypothetical protein
MPHDVPTLAESFTAPQLLTTMAELLPARQITTPMAESSACPTASLLKARPCYTRGMGSTDRQRWARVQPGKAW